MRFCKEYIRKCWDNQISIRIPANTEIISMEEEIGIVRVETNTQITKNLDTWLYMSKEEVDNFIVE